MSKKRGLSNLIGKAERRLTAGQTAQKEMAVLAVTSQGK
jgi:hypothetical protein